MPEQAGWLSEMPIQRNPGEPAPPWAAYDLPLLDLPAAETAAESQAIAADNQQLLLQNVVWFCRLRWLVIAALFGLTALALTAGPALLRYGIRLEPVWPSAVAAVLAVANAAYLAIAGRAASQRQYGLSAVRGLWLQIMLDLAMLTVVVHYLGSLETYSPFMYLFHIVLACIFFSYDRKASG